MSFRSSLPTLPLGRTDLNLTRIGLGTWALGGAHWRFGWGPQDDQDSIATIRHAIEQGINWLDTAAAYGLGHSETIVARALRDFSRDDRPILCTKGGLIAEHDGPDSPLKRIGDPAMLRRELEASLRRLEVDCIDVYYLHWPPEDGTLIPVYWQAMLDFKAEGKVRAIGLSNHNADQLEIAEHVGHVDVLQGPFSALRRDLAEREIPWCVSHGTGVLAYSPLQSGILSGSFSPDRTNQLASSDWRVRSVRDTSRSSRFTGEPLQQSLQFVEALRPIATRHNTNVATVAIAWVLAWPGITGTMIGARTPAQVDGWISAASLELSPQDLSEIAQALDATNAGTGLLTTRPAV